MITVQQFFKFIITFFSFQLLVLASNGQKCFEINGKIVDTTGCAFSSAIIIAKNSTRNYYSVSNARGFFRLLICDSISSVQNKLDITVNFLGYKPKDTTIYLSEKSIYLNEIVLKAVFYYLSDIIVQNRPITQKGDTTTFLMGAFKSKLDANLEDALRKMPGFDISSSGNILYNNKPIEDILIEGDALTKNYKQISKNISPDMIDKVEMVDKYNSNPILKNLTSGRKQVMNLTLKNPKKLKFFGLVKGGGGIKEKENIAGNLFVVNNKIKAMFLANHNNIGENPYDEISNDPQYSTSKDYEFANSFMPNYISENSLFNKSIFSSATSASNNSLFNCSNMGVINTSYTFSKKINLKFFTDTYNDKINQFQEKQTSNIIFPQLSYNENSKNLFTPSILNTNFQLKYLSKKTQLLIYGANTLKKYTESNTIISQKNYITNQSSTYKRNGIGGYFTQRIDSTSAFEISFQYIHDYKQQALNINGDSARFFDLASILSISQNQNTQDNINYCKAEIKYYTRKKNKLKQFTFSSTNFKSVFNSQLNLLDTANQYHSPDFLKNNTVANNDNFLATYTSSINLRKLTISGDIGLSFRRFSLNNTIPEKSRSLQFVPQLNIFFTVNNNHSFSGNIGYNSEYASLNNLYLNPLQVSYRKITSNYPFQNPVNSLKSTVTYIHKDIDNATSLILSWYHFTQYKSVVADIKFTKDVDYYTNVFESANQNIDNLYIKYDKYFYKLKTSISVKNSFTWFSNPLKVTGKLESSNNFAYSFFTSIRPPLGNDINLNLCLDYKFLKDISSGKSNYQLNPFVEAVTSLNKRLSFGVRCNYYNSNYFIENENYYYANITTWYSVIPKKIDIKLSVLNVFNTKSYYSGYKNNISIQTSTTETLPRFGLLEVIFKF